jgi:hypothetical protein
LAVSTSRIDVDIRVRIRALLDPSYASIQPVSSPAARPLHLWQQMNFLKKDGGRNKPKAARRRFGFICPVALALWA